MQALDNLGDLQVGKFDINGTQPGWEQGYQTFLRMEEPDQFGNLPQDRDAWFGGWAGNLGAGWNERNGGCDCRI